MYQKVSVVQRKWPIGVRIEWLKLITICNIPRGWRHISTNPDPTPTMIRLEGTRYQRPHGFLIRTTWQCGCFPHHWPHGMGDQPWSPNPLLSGPKGGRFAMKTVASSYRGEPFEQGEYIPVNHDERFTRETTRLARQEDLSLISDDSCSLQGRLKRF